MSTSKMLTTAAMTMLLATSTFAGPAEDLAGQWTMTTHLLGADVTARLVIEVDGEGVKGRWISAGEEHSIAKMSIEDDALTFSCADDEDDQDKATVFAGAVKDGRIEGTLSGPFGAMTCKGTRANVAPEALVGYWAMMTNFNGESIEGTLSLFLENGELGGVYYSRFGTRELADVAILDGVLTYNQSMGGGQRIDFEGIVEGDSIMGVNSAAFGTFKTVGTRVDL